MTDDQHLLAARIIEGLHLEDITPNDIGVDEPLFGEGLGLDSVDALELAMVVERHYGIKITDMQEGRTAFASIAALDAYIQARQGA